MKNKEFKLDASASKYFNLLLIPTILFFSFMMSGCAVTPYAVDFAEEKALPAITHTDWNISKVKSAVEQDNGVVSVCIELYESDQKNNSEYYTVNLPNSSVLKETTDLRALGFKGNGIVGNSDSEGPDPYILEYLYPLAIATKGCRKLESEKMPAGSMLPIVKLTFPDQDRDKLYSFLNEHNEQGPEREKLYEVTFVKMKEDRIADMNDNDPTRHSDVFLIYWPSETDQNLVKPIGLSGGYESEDESTNLYYLLVFPAMVVDLILLGLSGGPV